MLGAIIGDLAGSIYEFNQAKNAQPITVRNLISEDNFFTDDTILTVAILDAILNAEHGEIPDYESFLKEYGKKFINYQPKTSCAHFDKPFSPNFLQWVYGKNDGKSEGNGAMMRISPVAYLFNDIDAMHDNVMYATYTSHHSSEAFHGANMIATAIYLARQGYGQEEICRKLWFSCQYTPFTRFNYLCSDTVDNCLAVALTADSFEDAVRTIISLGGDTDTNACIVGSIAEVIFGIPKELKEFALAKIPDEFISVLKEGYSRIEPIELV